MSSKPAIGQKVAFNAYFLNPRRKTLFQSNSKRVVQTTHESTTCPILRVGYYVGVRTLPDTTCTIGYDWDNGKWYEDTKVIKRDATHTVWNVALSENRNPLRIFPAKAYWTPDLQIGDAVEVLVDCRRDYWYFEKFLGKVIEIETKNGHLHYWICPSKKWFIDEKRIWKSDAKFTENTRILVDKQQDNVFWRISHE